MNLEHDTAQQWLLRQRDGALTADQQQALESHLAGCALCRAEAQDLDAWQMTLDRGLRARYAGAVSAETMRKQRQLKQQLTQPRRTPRQLPALAVGLVALFAIVSVVLRVPSLSELQVTVAPPTSAIVQVDDATPTPTATATNATQPTDTVRPTETGRPTDLPPPTMTPVATVINVVTDNEQSEPISTAVAAVVEVAVPTATALPPAVQPTEPPPTATAVRVATVAPLPTQTAIPTAVVIAPTATTLPTAIVVTATSSSTATTFTQPNIQTVASLLNQGTAVELADAFDDTVVYAARGIGYRYLDNADFVREIERFQQLNSQFSFSNCDKASGSGPRHQTNCILTLQNDWRRAMGFAPYQAVSFVHFDVSSGRVTQLIAFQFNEQAESEEAEIRRLLNWFNASHDGPNVVYFSDVTNRIVYSAELLSAVSTWNDLGRP